MAFTGETFASGNSLIHRLDPRIRLICAGLLTVPTALLQTFPPAYTMLCAGILLIILSRLNLIHVLKRLLVVNVFIAFLWLFLPLSTPGLPLHTFGPFIATSEGVALAGLITVKSNAIVLTLMALMATIGVQDLGPAMQRLKVPNKLCHILLFTYRYIFVIYQEYLTMRQAMSARGFTPKTDSHTYRSYAWLVGMLLVKSWDRAERVFGAMRCRGYQGRFYSLTTFKTTAKDAIFLTGGILLCFGIIYLELSHRGLV